MSDNTPTFTFEDGQVYAFVGSSMVASGTKLAEVEKDALAYLDSLNTKEEEKVAAEKQRTATHIITPNGLKGRILGQTPDLFDTREVTVRFENNHVASLEIGKGDEHLYEWSNDSTTKTASANPVDKLEERLASSYEVDKDSLIVRTHELKDIAKEARHIATFGKAPLDIQTRVANVHTAAEHELTEVNQALAAIEQQAHDDNPFKPFESKVVVQADMGPTAHQASWLDITASEMIEEAESQDFDRLLAEGPAVFVADLDTGTVAHTGSVSQMAHSFIVSKTAGFEGEEVEEYRQAFVARTEVARRHELAARKASEQQKVAAAEEASDFPDEALFA